MQTHSTLLRRLMYEGVVPSSVRSTERTTSPRDNFRPLLSHAYPLLLPLLAVAALLAPPAPPCNPTVLHDPPWRPLRRVPRSVATSALLAPPSMLFVAWHLLACLGSSALSRASAPRPTGEGSSASTSDLSPTSPSCHATRKYLP